jgi:transposase
MKNKKGSIRRPRRKVGARGLKAVHELTGVSKTTIIRGKKELRKGAVEHDRIHKPGGGRKTIAQRYVNIQQEIENLTGNTITGSPEKVIVWTTKSLRNIAKALGEKGFGW